MNEATLKELNHLKTKPMFSVKDPISALTHFIGTLASIIACPLLLCTAAYKQADMVTMISLAVFAISMILLYGASTAYHSFILPNRCEIVLKKLDHISIFYLIAGSYTPICLSVLKGKEGFIMLAIIWLLAIGGTIMKLLWVHCPKYVSSIVYISMGWVALISIKSIMIALSVSGFFWLLLGGILYTIGGVLYSFNIKINEDWGNHEIFHLFVLAGSFCHYIMMLLFVA